MADQVSGKIFYANGTPAAGVHIRVFDRDIGNDDDLTVQEGVSANDGSFTVVYDRSRAADRISISILQQVQKITNPFDRYSPYIQASYSIYGQQKSQQFPLGATGLQLKLTDTEPVKGPFIPSKHGFHFLNSFPGSPLPFTIPTLPGINEIPSYYGLCGGMSASAADFFLAGHTIPDTQEIPAKGTPLYEYLFHRQMDSFSPFGEPILRFTQWMKMAEDTPTGCWSQTRQEFERLKAFFDAGMPAHPIGLVFANPGDPLWENHQVLACGYSQPAPNRIEIKVYDPNFPWNDQVVIRAEILEVSGLDAHGQQCNVGALRCQRVAVVADAHGQAVEQAKPMRGMFLMPYEPAIPNV